MLGWLKYGNVSPGLVGLGVVGLVQVWQATCMCAAMPYDPDVLVDCSVCQHLFQSHYRARVPKVSVLCC